MLAVVATTAVSYAGTASASSSDRDDLPAFGPGSQYRPVIDAKDFSPNVTNAMKTEER